MRQVIVPFQDKDDMEPIGGGTGEYTIANVRRNEGNGGVRGALSAHADEGCVSTVGKGRQWAPMIARGESPVDFAAVLKIRNV